MRGIDIEYFGSGDILAEVAGSRPTPSERLTAADADSAEATADDVCELRLSKGDGEGTVDVVMHKVGAGGDHSFEACAPEQRCQYPHCLSRVQFVKRRQEPGGTRTKRWESGELAGTRGW